MRGQRVTIALLSSVLLGLAPGTSAVAEGRTDLGRAAEATITTTIPSGSIVLTKPARPITEGMRRGSRGRIVFHGKVGGNRPVYRFRLVAIQRRTGSGGAWHPYQKVRTNGRAQYQCFVAAPRHGRWYYRAMVKGSSHYRTSYSDGHWYTY